MIYSSIQIVDNWGVSIIVDLSLLNMSHVLQIGFASFRFSCTPNKAYLEWFTVASKSLTIRGVSIIADLSLLNIAITGIGHTWNDLQ